jgi:transcriptional regulator with XRE-family HTH domain
MTDEVRNQIKQHLQREGITQAELAQQSGVRQDYVSKLLRGERGTIPKEWQKIVEALGYELTLKRKGE